MKNNINELYENINEIKRLNLLCPPLYYGNVDKYTKDLLDSDITDCMSVLQDFYSFYRYMKVSFTIIINYIISICINT